MKIELEFENRIIPNRKNCNHHLETFSETLLVTTIDRPLKMTTLKFWEHLHYHHKPNG